MLNLILFGPPGSGKGTQAKLLCEKLNLVHLSTGDILRKEIQENTPLGNEVKAIMERGDLVPDETVIKIISSRIDNEKNAKGFIFDGFPRTKAQAIALDALLNDKQIPLSMVLGLEVDTQELIQRILLRGKDSNRADDQDETIIENRLKEYHNKTDILKDYYTDLGKYYKIDGLGTIEEVFGRLSAQIASNVTVSPL